jgi:cysteine sulfinate desulfinase/cysteine desulfurase-like protein
MEARRWSVDGRESGGERERERRSGAWNLQTVGALARVAFIALGSPRGNFPARNSANARVRQSF